MSVLPWVQRLELTFFLFETQWDLTYFNFVKWYKCSTGCNIKISCQTVNSTECKTSSVIVFGQSIYFSFKDFESLVERWWDGLNENCAHGTGEGCSDKLELSCNYPGTQELPYGTWIVSICSAHCDTSRAMCFCGEGTKYPDRPAAESCGFQVM